MHCGKSRYVKVINKDVASVTTKVVVKQLHYIPITPRLKRLFLCKEMAQQMRWHKEGIRDSEDVDIISHPADVEAWHALDHFVPKFARDPRSVRLGLSMNGFQPYSSDSTAYSCWPIFVMPYNLSPNKFPKKQMNIFFASIDGRTERILARGRCI
jgi:hypothetical protein